VLDSLFLAIRIINMSKVTLTVRPASDKQTLRTSRIALGQEGYAWLTLYKFADQLGFQVVMEADCNLGMERDFVASEQDDAIDLYELVRGGGPVYIKDLLSLGFGYSGPS